MTTKHEPGPMNYNSTNTPQGYVCSTCGASGVKLWRLYQTFLSNQVLCCAACAALAEHASIEGIDADGRMPSTYKGKPDGERTDQIGWMVPAVPTEDGSTYWGYTSVPPLGVLWWKRLPTLLNTMGKEQVMEDKFERMLEEAEKLVTLLKEHETGIATWHEFVDLRMAKLNEIYRSKQGGKSTLRSDRPMGDGRRYR